MRECVCCGLVDGCMRWQTRELAAAKVHTLSIRRGQEQCAKKITDRFVLNAAR